MTGFGKASCEYNNKKIVIEIKSLNSKQLDVQTRIAALYREKDIELRNAIAARLERGKIDLSLYIEDAGATARAAATREGILMGISGGAALYAALKLAEQVEYCGKTICVIIPDSGERYLSSWLFEK